MAKVPPAKMTNRANHQMNNLIGQETVRIRGVPRKLDAMRVHDHTFVISGRFAKTASLRPGNKVWMEDVEDPAGVVSVLKSSPLKIDILRFWQRIPDTEPKFKYYKEFRQIAAIPISNYDHWLKRQITRSARNKIRKTDKFGVVIQETVLSDQFVRDITEIFNQSPVRRGKRFWHYRKNFGTVKTEMSFDSEESIFVSAYYKAELIGFIKLLVADRYAVITLILDKQNHRDKSPMNGMIAKCVEICAERRIPHIIYMMWRRGEHGQFQESMGFQRIAVPEYFVPLTPKGMIALRFGLHRGLKGLIPEKTMVWLLALRSKWYALRYLHKGHSQPAAV